MDEMLVLTPSALLDFLTQIEELKDKDIALDEGGSELSITIGDRLYELKSPSGSEVEVADEVIDELDDINEDGYESISEDVEEIEGEPVKGGVIKELIKTLAIGGLVRLTKNAITKA